MKEGLNRYDIIQPPRDEGEQWIEIVRLVKSIISLEGSEYHDRNSENDQSRSAMFKEARWDDPITGEIMYLRQWTSWATIYHGLPRRRYDLMIFREENGPVEHRTPDSAYRFFESNGVLEVRDESTYLDVAQYCRKHGEKKLDHLDRLYDYLLRGRDTLHITLRWLKEEKRYIDDSREFQKIVLADAVAGHSDEVHELKGTEGDARAERIGKIVDAIMKVPAGSVQERQIHPSSWRLEQEAVLVEILRQAV